MKRIYTFGHEQVERNITVGDIIQNKNINKKMTQVTAANQEEAEIIAKENIDMIITGSDWYEDVRKGAPNTFITAALFAGRFITCLLYTSPSPRDLSTSRMPSSA